jgi:hypothetical protein
MPEAREVYFRMEMEAQFMCFACVLALVAAGVETLRIN